MADDLLIMSATLRDEVSSSVEVIRRSLLRFDRDVKLANAKNEFALLNTTVRAVGNEIRNTLSLIGVSAVISAGSLVTGLGLASSAIANFSRSNLNLRYTAEELGLTFQQFKQFQFAFMALGKTSEQGANNVTSMARALQDLRKGADSSTWQALERGGFGSGHEFAKELKSSLERSGTAGAMQDVFKRMGEIVRSGRKDTNWAASVMKDAFGQDSIAFQDIEAAVKHFTDITEPSEKEMRNYMKALTDLQVQVDKLQITLGTALLPVFTKLMEELAGWLKSERGEAFIKKIKEMAEALTEMPWDKIREGVVTTLKVVGEAIGAFVGVLGGAVDKITEINSKVDQWGAKPSGKQSSFDVIGKAHAALPTGQMPMGGNSLNTFSERFSFEAPVSNKIGVLRDKKELIDETRDTTRSLKDLTDMLRDKANEAKNGSSFGSRFGSWSSAPSGGSVPSVGGSSPGSSGTTTGSSSPTAPSSVTPPSVGGSSASPPTVPAAPSSGQQPSLPTPQGFPTERLGEFTGPGSPSVTPRSTAPMATPPAAWPQPGSPDVPATFGGRFGAWGGDGMDTARQTLDRANRQNVDEALGYAEGVEGRLSLDVLVRGPRGTNVEAGVKGGDFIADDINVSREMVQ